MALQWRVYTINVKMCSLLTKAGKISPISSVTHATLHAPSLSNAREPRNCGETLACSFCHLPAPALFVLRLHLHAAQCRNTLPSIGPELHMYDFALMSEVQAEVGLIAI